MPTATDMQDAEMQIWDPKLDLDQDLDFMPRRQCVVYLEALFTFKLTCKGAGPARSRRADAVADVDPHLEPKFGECRPTLCIWCKILVWDFDRLVCPLSGGKFLRGRGGGSFRPIFQTRPGRGGGPVTGAPDVWGWDV